MKHFVTYKIYVKGKQKPILEYTREYRHQDEIHIRMREYRELGVIVNHKDNSVDWYPISSIDRIHYKTHTE